MDVAAVGSLSRSEQVKTLLAGPQPYQLHEGGDISSISNIRQAIRAYRVASKYVQTTRNTTGRSKNSKNSKTLWGYGGAVNDQDRNNFEHRLGLPFWHSGTHCDKISHRIAHSVPQQRVIYRKPFPNLEPSAIFLIEMASTKWR